VPTRSRSSATVDKRPVHVQHERRFVPAVALAKVGNEPDLPALVVIQENWADTLDPFRRDMLERAASTVYERRCRGATHRSAFTTRRPTPTGSTADRSSPASCPWRWKAASTDRGRGVEADFWTDDGNVVVRRDDEAFARDAAVIGAHGIVNSPPLAFFGRSLMLDARHCRL